MSMTDCHSVILSQNNWIHNFVPYLLKVHIILQDPIFLEEKKNFRELETDRRVIAKCNLSNVIYVSWWVPGAGQCKRGTEAPGDYKMDNFFNNYLNTSVSVTLLQVHRHTLTMQQHSASY
jgi:hypothetical protein